MVKWERELPTLLVIISHTSPWWAAGNNLVIGEDVGKENSQEESEWIIKNDSAIY